MADLQSVLLAGRVLDSRGALQVGRFLTGRYLRKRKIASSIQLGVTYGCQAGCRHCSASKDEYIEPVEHRKDHTFAEILTILDDLKAMGVPRVHLVGGEPSLRPDIEQVIEAACSRGLVTLLETNAMDLDLAIVKPRKNFILATSLDYPDAERHDRYRRLPGCFDKVMALLAHCERLGIPFLVSTWVSQNDFDKVRAFDRLIAGMRHSLGVRVLILRPSGRLLKNERLTLNKDVRSAYKAAAKGTRVWFGGYFGEPQCHLQTGEYFHINAYGDIMGCQYVPLKFGNVRERGLRTVLDEMYRSPLFDHEVPRCLLEDNDFMARVREAPGTHPVRAEDVALRTGPIPESARLGKR
jgi:MoaA/NifB/PqqE/SkfB family radical SAM enzyme